MKKNTELNDSLWTLSTDDTVITLSVINNRPAITKLMNPKQGWNWAEEPTEIPLLDRVIAGSRNGFINLGDLKVRVIEDPQVLALDWKFEAAEVDVSDGTEVTLKFTNAYPPMELKSVWKAKLGPGPVEHRITIWNNTDSSIMIFNQESLGTALKAGDGEEVSVWYVNKDAGAPFLIEYQVSGFGVYTDRLTAGYSKDIWTTVESNDTGFIPWMTLDAGGVHGLYVGWECNCGRINVSGYGGKSVTANIRAGLYSNFNTELKSGEIFDVPGVFIGTYKGEVDDGSNRLRKWLYNYRMPEINRTDASLPTVLWNAHWNTKDAQDSAWVPVESKFYPMVDAIAGVGMEEVVIDHGWWEEKGDWRGHNKRWASGMARAGQYTHEKGLKFSLYFTLENGRSNHPDALSACGENAHPEWFCGSTHEGAGANLGNPACEAWLRDKLGRLFDEYGVDTYRSDFDPIISSLNSWGRPRLGRWDTAYWAEKGFLSMVDHFYATRPGFKYQNCSNGGSLKSYAIMKRSAVVQVTDTYDALSVRQSLYDSSYCFPMMQLMGPFGDVLRGGTVGNLSYRLRNYLYAAPMAHIEHPGEMSEENRNYLAGLIQAYKDKIRPLVRTAGVYHIFPRPDGKNWDGLEYYDHDAGKGVVLVFRPDSDEACKVVRLKGLDNTAKYKISFEDRTNPEAELAGSELIENGISIALDDKYTAEWMYIEKMS